MKDAVCWFSCGGASAVATKLALKEYDKVDIRYSDTGSEHPDNKRFLHECEKWFGQEIIVGKREIQNIWDLFRKEKYIKSATGYAVCTEYFKQHWVRPEAGIVRLNQAEVLGYTLEEKHRADRFRQMNGSRKLDPILIRMEMTKADTLAVLNEAGIELPAMYQMGYHNNNCIGCVKGGAGYWNKIRRDFPEEFERMAQIEEELGYKLLKTTMKGKKTPTSLRDLPEDAGRYDEEKYKSIECGLFCALATQIIEEDEDEDED